MRGARLCDPDGYPKDGAAVVRRFAVHFSSNRSPSTAFCLFEDCRPYFPTDRSVKAECNGRVRRSTAGKARRTRTRKRTTHDCAGMLEDAGEMRTNRTADARKEGSGDAPPRITGCTNEKALLDSIQQRFGFGHFVPRLSPRSPPAKFVSRCIRTATKIKEPYVSRQPSIYPYGASPHENGASGMPYHAGPQSIRNMPAHRRRGASPRRHAVRTPAAV